jgi:flagellar assembly protein FliH
VNARDRGASSANVILRNVQLHAQPHTLARPAHNANRPAVASVPPETDSAAAQDAQIARIREEAFAAGRVEAERELQAEAQAVRARMYEEGRLQGFERGMEQAQEQIESACMQAINELRLDAQARAARIDLLADRLRTEVDERVVEVEDDMVALAFEAVCRILGPEAVRPENVQGMVRHLLVQHSQQQGWSVHIHPDDFAAMQASSGFDSENWKWVADESVGMGGVVLRSPRSSLDARLETQLERLRDVLTAQRTRRKVGE